MKVLSNRVLVVYKKPEEEKSAGGIYMTVNSKSNTTPVAAKVVAVGSHLSSEISVGDVIYHYPLTGDIIETSEGMYKSITEDDILAVE